MNNNYINFYNMNDGFISINGRTILIPKNSRKQTISMINGKLFVNGKKFNFKTGSWKTTITSLWCHYI